MYVKIPLPINFEGVPSGLTSDEQMAPRPEFLSVVIPAYNEALRVPPTIERVSEFLRGRMGGFEILLVDDGSTDHTVTFVRRMTYKFPAVRIIQSPRNMGKGHAVRAGVMEARGELILITDADLSTPIEEIKKLLPAIDGGADFAIGSRALARSEIMIRQPWHREVMGRTFNLIVRALVMGGLHDTQCGFKLMRAEAARRVFGLARIDGFAFDVEALYIARRLGYGIAEVPVVWLNSPSSRVGLVAAPASMFGELLRIRLNAALKRYAPPA